MTDAQVDEMVKRYRAAACKCAAKRHMTICKKICPQCPWRRASAPGFLGSASGDPWAFAAQHVYGDVHLPCHLHVDWGAADVQARALQAPMCRGFAVFMRNTGKLPADPALTALVREIEPDHDAIFSDYRQFHEHHHNPDLARSFRVKAIRAAQLPT